MSACTLQRQFADEGTSFRDLLDGARVDLARTYVAERRLSVMKIAFVLGFADTSAFSRAFKRWTGASPRDWARGGRAPAERGDPTRSRAHRPCDTSSRVPRLGPPARTACHGPSHVPDLDGYTHQVYPSNLMIHRVEISKLAAKQLRKLPRHIVDNLMIWVAAVEHDGLDEVRKVPGYHDEPLKGDRAGQRSIRLSRSYRAIYEVMKDTATFVSVEEVSKHEY